MAGAERDHPDTARARKAAYRRSCWQCGAVYAAAIAPAAQSGQCRGVAPATSTVASILRSLLARARRCQQSRNLYRASITTARCHEQAERSPPACSAAPLRAPENPASTSEEIKIRKHDKAMTALGAQNPTWVLVANAGSLMTGVLYNTGMLGRRCGIFRGSQLVLPTSE